MLTETFSTGFVVDVADIGEPEGGPSAQFLAAQAAEHGVWVCGTLSGDPRRRRRGRSATVQQLRVRRARRHHPSLPQDPLVHLRRRGQALPGRRRAHDAHHRRRARDAAGLLRPPFRRRVLAARRTTPTSSSSPPTGRRHAGCTGRRCSRPGRSRTWPTSSAAIASASGGGLDYTGDSRVVDPLGELLTTAAGDETTLLATIDPDRVAEVRARFGFLDDRR